MREDKDKWHFLILWMWVQREKREIVKRIRDIRAGYQSGSCHTTHCFCSSSLPSSRSLKQIGDTALGPALLGLALLQLLVSWKTEAERDVLCG